MARKVALAPELAERNVRTNNSGVELSQLHANGDYELNYRECYKEIVRWSFDPSRPVTIRILNREFGMRDGWGYDATVDLMVKDMVAIGVISYDEETGVIKPLMGIARAMPLLPPYTSLLEIIAGLGAFSPQTEEEE